jgi:hypothetical protein
MHPNIGYFWNLISDTSGDLCTAYILYQFARETVQFFKAHLKARS